MAFGIIRVVWRSVLTDPQAAVIAGTPKLWSDGQEVVPIPMTGFHPIMAFPLTNAMSNDVTALTSLSTAGFVFMRPVATAPIAIVF